VNYTVDQLFPGANSQAISLLRCSSFKASYTANSRTRLSTIQGLLQSFAWPCFYHCVRSRDVRNKATQLGPELSNALMDVGRRTVLTYSGLKAVTRCRFTEAIAKLKEGYRFWGPLCTFLPVVFLCFDALTN